MPPVKCKVKCKVSWVDLQLQQLTSKALQPSESAGNEVRLDISPRLFWEAEHFFM